MGKTLSESDEKAVFFMVFQDAALSRIQAALGRGFGRFCPFRLGAGKGVHEDTFSSATTGNTWLLPRLFPQRDSRYHTPLGRSVSRLGREREPALASVGPWRPKDLRKEPDPAGK